MEAVVVEEVLIQSLAVLNHYVMKVTFLKKWLIASEESTGFEIKKGVGMGYSCNANCECGFNQDGITVGAGMIGFERQSQFPHYCENCGVVEPNVQEQEIACPSCKSKTIIAYGNEMVSKQNELHDSIQWGKYKMPCNGNLCPKCKRLSLQFKIAKLFD